MNEFYPPFSEETVGEYISEGAESKVHEFDSDYVLKEPNEDRFAERIFENFEPEDEEDAKNFQELVDYMASEEHFRRSKEDYERLKKIFGDMMVDTQYVIGEPREGNRSGHYIFQHKVEGPTWQEFSKTLESGQREAFLEEHKDEFLTLIGGARKVLIETGGLMDLWAGNVTVDQSGDRERLAIIDPGSPTELNRLFEGEFPVPKTLQLEMTKRVQKMVSDLDQYAENLNLTEEEHAKMNARFDITDEDYETAKSELLAKCEKVLEENNPKPEFAGETYEETPRMRALTEKAKTISDTLPEVVEGNVRLWRGNRKNEIGKNPSFTTSLPGIALPFAWSYGGDLTFVDIPQTELDMYLVSGAENSEFILPKKYYSAVTIVDLETHETRPYIPEESGGDNTKEKQQNTETIDSLASWDSV